MKVKDKDKKNGGRANSSRQHNMSATPRSQTWQKGIDQDC